MDNKLKIEEWVLILLMLLIAFVTLTFEDKGCCGRIDGSCTKCCRNYQMIDRTCQECPAGFWDNNCSRVCQYPYFGINCLQTCQCNEHLCDNVEGCPDKTTMNNPLYTTSTSVVNGQMTVTAFKTSLETTAEKKGGIKITTFKTSLETTAEKKGGIKITTFKTSLGTTAEKKGGIKSIVLASTFQSVKGFVDNNGCCGQRINNICQNCCGNYYLVDHTCNECPAGFWGFNCSSVCDYPFFGVKCIQICDCNENICDAVKGCSNQTTLMSMPHTKNTSAEGKSQLNVVLLAGVVTPGFILVIAVVLLVVFLRRRRPLNGLMDVRSGPRILNSTTQEFLGAGFCDS